MEGAAGFGKVESKDATIPGNGRWLLREAGGAAPSLQGISAPALLVRLGSSDGCTGSHTLCRSCTSGKSAGQETGTSSASHAENLWSAVGDCCVA